MTHCEFWPKCIAHYGFTGGWEPCSFEVIDSLEDCPHRRRGDFAPEMPEDHEAIDEAAEIGEARREWESIRQETHSPDPCEPGLCGEEERRRGQEQ